MINKIEKEKETIKQWKIQRRPVKTLEITLLILSMIIIFIGVLFDTLVNNNIILIHINGFNSYVLTILGIQATISTLSIALVALISNNISEDYMGIAISDYYLNIRPALFKQNIIICASLVLIMLSSAAYIFSFYNILISLFVITSMLIFISSYEIYFLFRGLQTTKKEIKLYFSYVFNASKYMKFNYKNIENLMFNFISDWSNKANSQTHNEYNEYKEKFFHIIDSLLNIVTPKNVALLKEICGKQIYSFLTNENNKIKVYGIDLMTDVYRHIWESIINDNSSWKQIKEFNMFCEIVDVLYAAIKDVPFQLMIQSFNWECISDYIVRVIFNIGVDNETVISSSDLGSVLRFSSMVGNVVKFKEQYNHEYVEDMLYYWGRTFSKTYFDSTYRIPENRKECYLSFRCKYYFYYFKGFVNNGYMNIVKENIFFRSIANLYFHINKWDILYYLAIDCYLYYLSEKESTACVDATIKTLAKELLEDKRITNLNDFLFIKIAEHNFDYSELEDELYSLLKGCELFPKYSDSKTSIMDEVIREFYLFSQSIINRHRFFNNKKYTIEDEIYLYINQFLGDNKEQTKENLKRFYTLFQRSSPNKNVDDIVSNIYYDMEQGIKTIYKTQEMKMAEIEQNKYIDNIDEMTLVESITNKLEDHFKSLFGGLAINPEIKTKKWNATIQLLNYNLYTDMVNNEIIDKAYSNINDVFSSNIINELLLNGNFLQELSREKMRDEEFLNTLKEKNIKTLIGQEYIFKNTDYKNKNKFKDFLNKIYCIFYGDYWHGGVALAENTIKVNIKKVNVTIKSPTLKDIEYESDEEGEILSYKAINDILIPFQKDELIVYINNKRKILNISVELEFIVQDKIIGYHITRD